MDDDLLKFLDDETLNAMRAEDGDGRLVAYDAESEGTHEVVPLFVSCLMFNAYGQAL